MRHLDEVPTCPSCGTKLRFGEYDCAHCGRDMEDQLRDLAIRIADAVDKAR